jgi:hypothetical protein
MKTAITALTTTLATTTAALAAVGPHAEGMGLLTWLFLGFGALIVLCQCVPAAVLFTAMVRGLFAGTATRKAPQAH